MEILYLSSITSGFCAPDDASQTDGATAVQTATISAVNPNPPAVDSLTPSGLNRTAAPQGTAASLFGKIFQWGSLNIDAGASAGFVYNDNIDLAESNKRSDLIYTISPKIQLGAGDFAERKESWLTLDYDPSYIGFISNPGDDAIDQDASFHGEWRPANWTFDVSQRFQRTTGPIVEAGARSVQHLYITNACIKYELDPKVTFDLDGTYTIDNYNSTLFSYRQTTVTGLMDYWITPKIKIGAGGLAGLDAQVEDDDQSYQQIVLRAEYWILDTFAVRASGGPELREFRTGEKARLDGVFSLGGIYQVGTGTSLVFDAYRKSEDSLVADDENYVSNGLSIGMSQLFAQRYTFRLTGGVNHAEYYATAPGVRENRPFDYFFFNTSIDWQISPEVVAGVLYQYQQNVSQEKDSFKNNVAGVNLIFVF